jgi:hypothetical protein
MSAKDYSKENVVSSGTRKISKNTHIYFQNDIQGLLTIIKNFMNSHITINVEKIEHIPRALEKQFENLKTKENKNLVI